MRKLLKVLLPPLIGFAAYFIAIRFSSGYFTLRADEMGEGTIASFIAYYCFYLPLLFTVAILTQLLIVVPIWNKVFLKSNANKFISLFTLCFICLFFAAGISFMIWDKQFGVGRLFQNCIFMTLVQLVYWIINLFVLYLLTKKAEQLPSTAA